jgi:hypothetical protein
MNDDADTVQAGIRFRRPLYDRIVKKQEEMQRNAPGAEVSFSDAVRVLVEMGLGSGEAARNKRKR